jgi:hypothetical protein
VDITDPLLEFRINKLDGPTDPPSVAYRFPLASKSIPATLANPMLPSKVTTWVVVSIV